MRNMVSTKLFRNGGSVAVRIPAGWLNPDKGVHLVRDHTTGRIYISQTPLHIDGFFDFLRGKEYLPDPAFDELSLREEPPRALPESFDQ